MALKDDLEAARHVETQPISEPRRTHAPVKNRSETGPAVPLQPLPTMENSELRSRLPQLQSSSNVDHNGESSTGSGIALTPTSSEDSEHIQGT
jgi:hypothetical protein